MLIKLFQLSYLFSFLWLGNGAQNCNQSENSIEGAKLSVQDSVANPQTLAQAPPPLKTYTQLRFINEETLHASSGTKSVLFNPKGDKLYALNLEGMSVYEYDQASKKLLREFKFKATPGTGWDYDTDKPIKSFEEKPVEAAFSDDGKILWVSLHNAEGIVPIHIEEGALARVRKNPSDKEVYLHNESTQKTDTVYVPIIKTGKTPKVIAVSADSKHLLVSNWHSYSVSVLELNGQEYPYGKVIKEIPVGAIPRGVLIDDKNQKSYIAIMGGARINVIDNKTWDLLEPIQVASNPRHIVMDKENRLFVSFNKLGQVACIDALTGKTLFTAATKAQPRTIQISKNGKFLFVTCYKGNTVDVFKITEDKFELITSIPSKGSPVGIDIYEDDNKLEAWVCNYTLGTIKVFNFSKE